MSTGDLVCKLPLQKASIERTNPFVWFVKIKDAEDAPVIGIHLNKESSKQLEEAYLAKQKEKEE